MTYTDQAAWHIYCSHNRVIEIIIEKTSNVSRDFQTKSYSTSISNVQDICICFCTLTTHSGLINTDGLESVQFPKVRHQAQWSYALFNYRHL